MSVDRSSFVWVVLQDDKNDTIEGYKDRLLGIFSTNDKAEKYGKQVIQYFGEWITNQIVIRKEEIDKVNDLYIK